MCNCPLSVLVTPKRFEILKAHHLHHACITSGGAALCTEVFTLSRGRSQAAASRAARWGAGAGAAAAS